jgi:hypothetical protein
LKRRDVCLWHKCDIARSRMDVRFRGKSGRAADITGTTDFDPRVLRLALSFARQGALAIAGGSSPEAYRRIKPPDIMKVLRRGRCQSRGSAGPTHDKPRRADRPTCTPATALAMSSCWLGR